MDGDGSSDQDIAKAAEAIGGLAKDEEAFRAVGRALRMQDRAAFAETLEKLQLWPRCRWICEWYWSKECVRVCVELCGLPSVEEPPLDVDGFAAVVARLTANEALLTWLVYAVEQRDREDFDRLIEVLDARRYCHLLCHWVCWIRARLACDWLCGPPDVERRPLVSELQVAGAAVRRLAEAGALADAVKAVEAADYLGLRSVLAAANLTPGCFWLCEWFCSWRCVRVCFRLCGPFVLERLDTSWAEMLDFAQATERLAASENALPRLRAAVETQDAEAYSALVTEFQLERYCLQLCHWLCGFVCRGFCVLVCPPGSTIPLFTRVGLYHVDPVAYNDFTADGTTTPPTPTGPSYAFTGTIPLIGLLPDGSAPDALEYRFRFAQYPGPGAPQDVDAGMVAPTRIGELEYWAWNAMASAWVLRSADYWVNNPGAATLAIPQQFGADLLVSVNKPVKPGGWIEIPRENALSQGGVGRFVPQGGLVDLDTTKLSDQSFDLTVAAPPLPHKAGAEVPLGQQAAKPTFQLVFEARNVATLAAVSTNALAKIAISNTHYTYVRHPLWAGGTVTNRTVASLDIAELIGPGGTGCNDLSSHAHALFTAYHPYLGAVSVYLEGPGVPSTASFAPPLPHPAGGAISVAGGQDFNIAGLAPCAYIMWLAATVNLTSGYGLIGDATLYDHIAFCKE
jgi:hypothetical protein